jgi:hypothetical protein
MLDFVSNSQINIPKDYLDFANKYYGEHGAISAPLLQFKLKVSHNMANDIIKALNISKKGA